MCLGVPGRIVDVDGSVATVRGSVSSDAQSPCTTSAAAGTSIMPPTLTPRS